MATKLNESDVRAALEKVYQETTGDVWFLSRRGLMKVFSSGKVTPVKGTWIKPRTKRKC